MKIKYHQANVPHIKLRDDIIKCNKNINMNWKSKTESQFICRSFETKIAK